MKITICRRETFNAAHRLYKPEWSDEKNFEVYGKCSYGNFHGHNYVLKVKLTGETDKITGYLIDLKEVSQILKEEVVERYDHRNLNEDTNDFRELVPTTENLAYVIWNHLRKRFPGRLQLVVEISETEKNSVEYAGD